MAADGAPTALVCPSPELIAQLRTEGLDSQQILKWLKAEDVESREDLAAAFRNAEEVIRVAAFVAEPWAWAVRTGQASWEANQEARHLLSRLRVAGREVVAPITEALARTKKARARRPRPKAQARQEKDLDQERRRRIPRATRPQSSRAPGVQSPRSA